MIPVKLAAHEEPEVELARANARISWVLAHSECSDWLKQALRTALDRDPIEAANDAELLRHLLVPLATADTITALDRLALLSD